MGKLLSEATAATGGSLLITTSPRTSDAVAAALQRSIRAPSHFHSWRDEGMGNPYLAFLALADRIVVTSDSASMIAEACATGKPVSLFELPLRRDVASKLLRAINQVLRRPGGDGLAEEPGTWRILPRQTFDRLVELGVFMPARDMAAYCQALVARGMINRLGEPSNTLGRQTQDDATKVVERICALMTMKRAGFS
ncbi:MAG: ELM1/GtrOC1 family putative glycosyltransferase [Dongiaceae bacterium]